jgi:serine/threonine protein kinase
MDGRRVEDDPARLPGECHAGPAPQVADTEATERTGALRSLLDTVDRFGRLGPDARLPEELFGSSKDVGRLPARDGPAVRPPPTAMTHEPARRRPGREFPVGAILDKYRIEEAVGRGSFGTVYRATHLLLKTAVAVKVLRRRSAAPAHDAEDDPLCEEARFAARVNHPNVVRVFDVCAGLEAALKHGLIHRDVKPANILLAEDGAAKVVDLGLAMKVDRPEVEAGGGWLVGTPQYISPEQSRSTDAVDFRADIYSLGITLYHAVVGRPPFIGHDASVLVYQHRNKAPPDPRSLRPDVPAGLARVIIAMIEKSPESRPASYGECIRWLRDALSNTSESVGEPPRSSAEGGWIDFGAEPGM